MTAIEQHAGSDLILREDQNFWTPNQRAALAQMGVDRASDADLAVFFHQCTRTGLDPFARQIYMIERQGKQTIQTGIDGFRLIGRRAVDRSRESLEVSEAEWCGTDGVWRDVWLSKEPPAAARVTVYRNGGRFPAIALYDEYVGRKRDGNPTQMWSTRPAGQLAKCAEALAWRKAFPQDLSGLYTSDEMAQADNQPAPRQQRAQQSRPQAPVSSGEPVDWYARLDQCATKDDVNRETHALIQAHGGKDNVPADLQQTINALWTAMNDAESEVVQAEVVDETTGEVMDGPNG